MNIECCNLWCKVTLQWNIDSSFNNNKSWLLTNKLKHWVKSSTIYKWIFFSKFDFNNWCYQIPCECLLYVNVYSDYQIFSLDFASFIVKVYFWLPSIKVNFCIDYQHQFATFASTININSCIDYQRKLLMSTCASTTNVDKLCTHTPQVTIHNYYSPCHSP